jgi:hypothetical protein
MNYFVKLSFVVGIIFTVLSCAKEDNKKVFDRNTLAQRLNFKTVEIDPKENRDRENDEELDTGSTITITIVTWDEWGRKKKQCKGWGLCNADWFPKDEEPKESEQNRSYKVLSNELKKYSSLIEYEKNTDRYYMDILLSKPLPSDIPTDQIDLVIDEPIELNTKDILSCDLIFNNDNYPFLTNLGDYGGYRLYLLRK